MSGDTLDWNESDNTAGQSVGIPTRGGALMSCVTCRRRKVKCDKKSPCSHCSRANIECTFPISKRIPRQQYVADLRLSERVNTLETLVAKFGDEFSEKDAASLKRKPSSQLSPGDSSVHSVGADQERSSTSALSSEPIVSAALALTPLSQSSPNAITDLRGDSQQVKDRGKMVREDGHFRYVDSFWTTVNEMNDAGDADDSEWNYDEDEDEDRPSNTNKTQTSGLFCLTTTDDYRRYPPSNHILRLWLIYKERFDPVVKILHVPTTEAQIFQATDSMDHIPTSLSLLIHAISYAAITSVNEETSLDDFGESRQVLLLRYRQSFESNFTKFDKNDPENLQVLQALVIYLTALRRHDAIASWLFIGFAVRLAQLVGVHRDGLCLGLSPFETELRRRVWWNLLILEGPSSEDLGCDPTFLEIRSDAEYPCNVSDADLRPEMTELPGDTKGFTETTFTCVRAEVVHITRTMRDQRRNAGNFGDCFALLTLEEKERWISECEQHFEKKYLQYCLRSHPHHWVTATFARLIFAKIRLNIYNPLAVGASLSSAKRQQLFARCLQNIDYSYQLRTDDRGVKWRWLFSSYVQWHSLAFVLRELVHNPFCKHNERAWKSVEQTFVLRWVSPHENGNSQHQWKLMLQMADRARAVRAAATRHKRASMSDRQAVTHTSNERAQTSPSSTHTRLRTPSESRSSSTAEYHAQAIEDTRSTGSVFPQSFPLQRSPVATRNQTVTSLMMSPEISLLNFRSDGNRPPMSTMGTTASPELDRLVSGYPFSTQFMSAFDDGSDFTSNFLDGSMLDLPETMDWV